MTNQVILHCKIDHMGTPVTESDFSLFNQISEDFYNICSRYSQLCMAESYGECYIDLTYTAFRSFPDRVASDIRAEVARVLSRTVSVGIGFNIFISDIALINAGENGILHLTPDTFRQTLWEMDMCSLPDIGASARRRLARYSIYTAKDIALVSQDKLRLICGRDGAVLWDRICGFDERQVVARDFSTPVKVVGEGFSGKGVFDSNEDIRLLMLILSDRISARLSDEHLKAGKLQLIIRDSDMRSHEYSALLPVPASGRVSIARHAYELFKASYGWQSDITSVIIKVTELTHHKSVLFDVSKNEIGHLAPVIFGGVTYAVNSQSRKQTQSDELKAFAEFFSCRSC